jgi:hypothetical protein
MAFLHVYQWHHQVFAIDDRGDVWRFYFEGVGTPYIMKLIGNENEYADPIHVLKAMMRAR